QKLRLFSDSQIAGLWDRVRSETDPSVRSPLPLDASVVDATFFRTDGSPDDLRGKIATYIVTIKPRLVLSLLKSGGPTVVPLRVIGLARLLAINAASAAEPLEEWEVSLARLLGRIGRLWATLGRDRQELIGLLRLPEQSAILDSRESRDLTV